MIAEPVLASHLYALGWNGPLSSAGTNAYVRIDKIQRHLNIYLRDLHDEGVDSPNGQPIRIIFSRLPNDFYASRQANEALHWMLRHSNLFPDTNESVTSFHRRLLVSSTKKRSLLDWILRRASPRGILPQPVEGLSIDHQLRLEGQLGRGTFGTVWKATDLTTERTFAVKIFDRDASESHTTAFLLGGFCNEIRWGGTGILSGVTRVFSFGLNGTGQPYLVMEYMGNGDILEHFSENQYSLASLGERRLLEEVEKLVRLVARLHQEEVIHRDIQEGNILAHGEDRRLSDFGMALYVSEWHHLPLKDKLLGGTYFSKPGRANCEMDNVYRADVFALGMTVLRLLFRDIPDPEREDDESRWQFQDSLREALFADTEHRVVPASLKPILEKATTPIINDRYYDAQEMHRAILVLLES